MAPRHLVSLLLVFAASFGVLADTIYLKDGTQRDGTIKHEKDGSILFEMSHGPLKAEIEIARKDILRIESKAVEVRHTDWKYQLLLQEARYFEENSPQDAIGTWERIAAFCEENKGFAPNARAAYEKVLALNPNHETARAKLRVDETAPRHFTKVESPVTHSVTNSVANVTSTLPSQSYYTPPVSSTERSNAVKSYSRSNNNTRSPIPVVYAYSDGRQLRFALLGYGYAQLPTNLNGGARSYTSRPVCGSNNYTSSVSTNRYTVGSFQNALNSYVRVPNSYFGISTGDYNTPTQTWRKR